MPSIDPGTVALARVPVHGGNGAVAAGHQAAADVGLDTLKRGGNAVDAVIAAAFASFVVEPGMCGIGGHGRMSIYLPDRRIAVGIDHFIRAPAGATAERYRQAMTHRQNAGGTRSGSIGTTGHLSVGIPGAIAGLDEAHQRFGKMAWSDLVGPAIDLADAGLTVDARLAAQIATRALELRGYPSAASWLLRDGLPPHAKTWSSAGDRLDFTAMARSLRQIRDHGAAAFYAGPIADAIERDMSAHGGVLTARDLAHYRPHVFAQPVCRYRGHGYVTCGDLISVEMLNILERLDVAGADYETARFRHLFAEALAQAFVDNLTFAGDPAHLPTPLDGLADKDYAAHVAQRIAVGRAQPAIRPGDPWEFQAQRGAEPPPPFEGTTQICAVDQQGMVVSLITSVGSSFGSLVMVPDTGILLGNAMQWFDLREDRLNSIGPGRMPLYAAPVLIACDETRATGALAGSGGYRIATAVLHPFVLKTDFGIGAQAALEAPRVHHQGEALLADSRIPLAVRTELAAMGHRVEIVDARQANGGFGRPSGVWREAEGWAAASDPMAGGVAAW
ncbi:MAG: hypothetical protein FJX35_23445 [Alphaproteobacteria bacterium]|nr:hypothetical protein [Alphaproteobacteria bacterium]